MITIVRRDAVPAASFFYGQFVSDPHGADVKPDRYLIALDALERDTWCFHFSAETIADALSIADQLDSYASVIIVRPVDDPAFPNPAYRP